MAGAGAGAGEGRVVRRAVRSVVRAVARATTAAVVTLAAVVTTAASTAPAARVTPAAAHATPAALSVTDDWGRVVQLPRPPVRIVSLAPHATELLIAAGAGRRLAAVDADSDDPALPAAIARVVAYPAPQVERVLAQRPDLVVLWGAAVRRELVERFTRLGVPVFVSDPRTHAGIVDTLHRFGVLAGDPAAARQAAGHLRSGLDALAARHATRAPVRVFVQVWNRPLMTLSDRDAIGEALALCGAVNVFGQADRAARLVGPEAVIAAAPALILAFEPAVDEQPWRDLGVLAPRGPIVFERIPRALQRASHRIVDAVATLCTTIDRHRPV